MGKKYIGAQLMGSIAHPGHFDNFPDTTLHLVYAPNPTKNMKRHVGTHSMYQVYKLI
jgi:hypothetical protein